MTIKSLIMRMSLIGLRQFTVFFFECKKLKSGYLVISNWTLSRLV